MSAATPSFSVPATSSGPLPPPAAAAPSAPSLDSAEPRPVAFPEANLLYRAPGGDLPCYRAEGAAVSCWYFPSWRDRVAFLLTGRLWLYLLAPAHPPASLTTRSPFPPRN